MKTIEDKAHDYLRDMICNWDFDNDFDVVAQAWDYAEAMQSEAEKRKGKGCVASLTKDENGNCLHFHHEFGHKKCMDCGASLEEWQPDWSQAPEWANYHLTFDDVRGIWLEVEPEINVNSFADNGKSMIAPSFGYKGDWKDSLRKRP